MLCGLMHVSMFCWLSGRIVHVRADTHIYVLLQCIYVCLLATSKWWADTRVYVLWADACICVLLVVW